MDCAKKVDSKQKILRIKLTKMVKPVLKLLARSRKPNAVTPSTCNYDVVESTQNDLNETGLFKLHFQFYGEGRSADEENARNEELENRLRESVSSVDTNRFGILRVVDGDSVVDQIPSGTYFAVPVHFVESSSGGFTWAPIPDRDVCRRGDDFPISSNQVPQQQVPVLITSAA